MTRDEILNMPAGQDMDLLVAEEVLKLDSIGWNERFFHNRARFSTDISAAWEVVEKLTRFSITIESFPKGVLCRFFGAGQSTAGDAVGWGDTAPLAICRAALLAVEAE